MGIHFGPGPIGTPNNGDQIFTTATIMVTVAGLFVCARLAIRGHLKKCGWDDYLITLSLLVSIILTISMNMAVHHGYGMHKNDIPKDDLRETLRWFWIANIVYKIEVGLTKASIVLLYLRIFVSKPFRVLCYLTLFTVGSWSVASTIATIFTCVPVAAAWNNSSPIENLRCIDSDAFWYSYGIINIVTDLIIIMLPIREILMLQMPVRERIELIPVFTCGIFVIATSILRVIAVANSTQHKADSTWSFATRSTWTIIEANMGIICACLPTLRQLVFRVLPTRCLGKDHSGKRHSRSHYTLGPHSWAVQHGCVLQTTVTAQEKTASDGDSDMIELTGKAGKGEIVMKKEVIQIG